MSARRVDLCPGVVLRAILTALLALWAAPGTLATAPGAGAATEAALAFERGLQIFEEARALEAKAPAER
ncbi:MAG TPA: hypothetical protein VMT52_11305, partial [Planctomycetota bacterium]|nr:hypothetical protein [Planctomycetota bacterium]